MNIRIPLATLHQTLATVLRQAGYQLYRTQGSELVFSRRLSRTNFFPRFHLYLRQTPAAWEGNLHYDLRQTVQAHPVHGEEYSGAIVADEFQRVMEIINRSAQPVANDPAGPLPAKSFEGVWLAVIFVAIILLIIFFL
ncbi:MAG: hypothetical protein NTV81_01375 [Candidatus Komeilibacteria bacterium]|nr:hypothetical protein [Candidatus Komeilibacteria bacterium]